ncbi:MAG TPA: hypothetical protein VGT41_00285 [Candidatus Babeliales bacterium]|nr:hypothetical protein [Candidatus Babeliales bacterium]
MNMILGLSVLGGTLYIAQTNVFAVKAYLFSFSPVFAERAKQNIIDYVKQSSMSTVSSPVAQNYQLTAAIKQQFSCVKRVATQLLPSGAMRVVIDAVEPVLCVNDTYLLAAESGCISKDLFIPSCIAQLPTIRCAVGSGSDIPVALHQCKQKFSPALCNTYDVIWQDEFCIRLQDKQETKFSIICSAQCIPDQTCLLQCEQLKKTVFELSDARKAVRDKQWVADVRFNDQIVVYSEKKGA